MKVHAPAFTPPLLTSAAPAAKDAAAPASGQIFQQSLGGASQGGVSTQSGDRSRSGRGDTAQRRAATATPSTSASVSPSADPVALAGDTMTRSLDAPYAPGSLVNIKA